MSIFRYVYIMHCGSPEVSIRSLSIIKVYYTVQLYFHISLSWTRIKTCPSSSSFNFHVLTIHRVLLLPPYTVNISSPPTHNKTHSLLLLLRVYLPSAHSSLGFFPPPYTVITSPSTVHYTHGLNNLLQCALSGLYTFRIMPKFLILHPFSPAMAGNWTSVSIRNL